MARINVYLDEKTHNRLQEYLKNKYGEGHRILSISIQQAVNEFLDRQEQIETMHSTKGAGKSLGMAKQAKEE